MEERCEIYERECINCGECDICDLDQNKHCDNCGLCIDEFNDYRSVTIDDFVEQNVTKEQIDRINKKLSEIENNKT